MLRAPGLSAIGDPSSASSLCDGHLVFFPVGLAGGAGLAPRGTTGCCPNTAFAAPPFGFFLGIRSFRSTSPFVLFPRARGLLAIGST